MVFSRLLEPITRVQVTAAVCVGCPSFQTPATVGAIACQPGIAPSQEPNATKNTTLARDRDGHWPAVSGQRSVHRRTAYTIHAVIKIIHDNL